MVPPGGEPEARAALGEELIIRAGPRLLFAEGGAERADSVKAGLLALARGRSRNRSDTRRGPALGQRRAPGRASLPRYGALRAPACPALPLADTIKRVGRRRRHRRAPGAVVAPCRADAAGFPVPRPAVGLPVRRGFCLERPPTTRRSGPWPAAPCRGHRWRTRQYQDNVSRGPAMNFRVGQGWDIHRLAPGRRLVLGGVDDPIRLGRGRPFRRRRALSRHSRRHARRHGRRRHRQALPAIRPAGRTRRRGYSSSAPLELLAESGWRVVNVDATVMLERPRLVAHIDDIRGSIAEALGLPPAPSRSRPRPTKASAQSAASRPSRPRPSCSSSAAKALANSPTATEP